MTALYTAILLAFSSLLLHRLYLYVRYEISRRQHGCGTPIQYPHRDPLGLGYFYKTIRSLLEKRLMAHFEELYEAHGNTVVTYSLGKTIVNTVEPANLQVFMGREFNNFGVSSLRSPVAAGFLGPSVFTSDGPYWQRCRSEIRPVFARGEITNMGQFERQMSEAFEDLPLDGSLFNISPILNDLFLSTSLDYLFAQSILFPGKDMSLLNQEFRAAFQAASAGVRRRAMLGRLADWIPDKQYDDANAKLHQVVDMYIEAGLKYLEDNTSDTTKSIGRSTFLLDLLSQTQEKEHLRNQLLATFLAGHDSSSVAVENALYELSRHPEAWARAREEALSLKGKPLLFDSVRAQHYIYNVIRETLRLYSPAPGSASLALKDIVLPHGGQGGKPLLVAKGTTIRIHRYVLHTSERLWGETARSFVPERWENMRQGWHYLPFNGGARTCPAQVMAMAETAATLIRILQLAEKAEGEGEWGEAWSLVLRNANGTWLRLHK